MLRDKKIPPCFCRAGWCKRWPDRAFSQTRLRNFTQRANPASGLAVKLGQPRLGFQKAVIS